MPERHFKNRRQATKHFANMESESAYFTDEDGEMKHVIKSPKDESIFSQLLSSFASTEDAGIPTSLEEVEALINRGRELGYEYTAENIRTEIAKRRKNKRS